MLVFYCAETNYFAAVDRRQDVTVWRSEYRAYESVWAVPGTLV